MQHTIKAGQVWRSDTGNLYRVVRVEPASIAGWSDMVTLTRLNPPSWDDGKYVWLASQFETMELVSPVPVSKETHV